MYLTDIMYLCSAGFDMTLDEWNKSAPEECHLTWAFDILKPFSAFEARLQSDMSDSHVSNDSVDMSLCSCKYWNPDVVLAFILF